MITPSDPVDWGEPPVTVEEATAAAALDRLLLRLENDQPIEPKVLAAEFGVSGSDFVRTLDLLLECVASVGEDSGILAATTSTIPDPFPGEFRFRRVVGAGSFGEVWLADDLHLGRQAALKTLKTSAPLAPGVLKALRNEARCLAQLSHPNVVQVYSWREAASQYYLVMEFVEGGSLADRLKSHGALDWREAAHFVADVGEGLLTAHARGIIHRDIKPANILIKPANSVRDAERDEAMLTDFGLAAHLAAPDTIAGTRGYMAPEAFAGDVSPAIDVYSLAATLFHLITGTLPFGRDPTVLAIERGLPDPDPRCRPIPEPLDRIIRGGLAASPRRRTHLSDFVGSLRGSLNQLLADALASAPAIAKEKSPVTLELVVRRRGPNGVFSPVMRAQSACKRGMRDMRKVPDPPEQVCLRSGDLVRVEVTADRDGCINVFNIGPTGNLNVLYPDEADLGTSVGQIRRGEPLHVLDVEMVPPVGVERLFAVWSRAPLALRPEEIQSLVEREVVESRPYRATRDMKRIQASVQPLRPEDWHAVVLELDHRAKA